jgi:hypothetical protein
LESVTDILVKEFQITLGVLKAPTSAAFATKPLKQVRATVSATQDATSRSWQLIEQRLTSSK